MQKICATLFVIAALCGAGCATAKKEAGCCSHESGHKHVHGEKHAHGEKHDCTKGECQVGTVSK